MVLVGAFPKLVVETYYFLFDLSDLLEEESDCWIGKWWVIMYDDHVVVLLHHGHVLPYGFYLGQKVGFSVVVY
ncbi:unnamed protein product [Prunus armeniaca]